MPDWAVDARLCAPESANGLLRGASSGERLPVLRGRVWPSATVAPASRGQCAVDARANASVRGFRHGWRKQRAAVGRRRSLAPGTRRKPVADIRAVDRASAAHTTQDQLPQIERHISMRGAGA